MALTTAPAQFRGWGWQDDCPANWVCSLVGHFPAPGQLLLVLKCKHTFNHSNFHRTNYLEGRSSNPEQNRPGSVRAERKSEYLLCTVDGRTGPERQAGLAGDSCTQLWLCCFLPVRKCRHPYKCIFQCYGTQALHLWQCRAAGWTAVTYSADRAILGKTRLLGQKLHCSPKKERMRKKYLKIYKFTQSPSFQSCSC